MRNRIMHTVAHVMSDARRAGRRARLRHVVAVAVAAVAVQLAIVPAAGAAASPSMTVVLSPAQVARTLFVAGDVNRLSQVPSGTEAVVVEKVLQQLYIENPTLSSGQAVSDIQGLQAALQSGSQAIAPATLTVMAGNARILAVLRVLTNGNPPSDVLHALLQVTDQALNQSSNSTQSIGQPFDPSADSLSTDSYAGFSPARVLDQTATLAASNHAFGVARDTLWKQVSNESVFDDTKTLLAENPALQNTAIAALTGNLAADGSLTSTVGDLESLVAGAVTTIGQQNCTLAANSTGQSPSDCVSGALHDAQLVASQCPTGQTPDGACQAAKNQATADAADEIKVIAAQEAGSVAAAQALGAADQSLQQAETAEAQAAAQVADDENQYLTYQTTGSLEKTGFDLATLGVSLSVSEIDPVWAVSGLFSVIGDVIGFGFSGPDPNTIILQGIQDISQQLSDFENYTQTAFHVLNSQLAGLTSQIAIDTYQLSAQLTQAQAQITQLASTLTTLQGSVDHLESEVQSLFAQGARNDLASVINTYIGYQQTNHVQLSQAQFAQAAGQLLTDATQTAVTQTVLTIPSGFDAQNANANLSSATDPLTLDSNINYFNQFGSSVTDSPFAWPGNLSNGCAANSNPQQGLCLPDPDFWATSARAFAQLLTENPQDVTQQRLSQLSEIETEGQTIANALVQLSANNAGSDPHGTGNVTLDAAINYYKYWGENNHASGAPSLEQALLNEEQRYLNSQDVPGLPGLSYGVFYPWGNTSQTPDVTGLVTTSQFKNIPLCQSEVNDGITGTINPDNYIYPKPLTTQIIAFLPAQVLNAVRLGIGHLSVCWTATFSVPETAQGGPFTIGMQFTYVGPSATNVQDVVGTITGSTQFASFCPPNGILGNQEIEALNAVVAGCNDTNGILGSGTQSASYPSDVSGYVENAVGNSLVQLQARVYQDILSNGSTLTTGTDQSTNIEAAAERLGGATALLNGYISLGLPQALGSDDTLQGLVSGQDEDAFARTNPNYNLWNVAPARSVPAQLVNFYQAAMATMPGFDPANFVADLVDLRASALQRALRPHIVPSVAASANARLLASTAARANAQNAAQTTPPSSGVLAELNPLIGPTLDRIDETRAALADTITNGTKLILTFAGSGAGTVADSSGTGISCSGTCIASPTPGATITLTATPAAGSTFTGWSGACTGTSGCTVTMSYDQTVTATFTSTGARTTTTTTTTTTPSPTTTATTITPGATTTTTTSSSGGHTTTAKCTLRVLTTKVRVTASKRKRPTSRPGTIALTARCDRATRVTLTGTLTRRPTLRAGKRRPRPTVAKLGPVNATVKANRAVTLTVKLPTTAINALATMATESATFTLTSTGGGRATAKIPALKAAR